MNFTEMHWLGEPPEWTVENDLLHVTTGERTDFWRETHYGFVRDNGHFLYAEAEGDFSAKVTFSARYEHLYDQAGLMLRLDERRWVKAGVEYSDGKRLLSTVVTRERSDWSVTSLPDNTDEVTLRLTRRGGALLVQALRGGHFDLLRLADFPSSNPVQVGIMCCTPERAGLKATFRDFRVGPPEGELHAS